MKKLSALTRVLDIGSGERVFVHDNDSLPAGEGESFSFDTREDYHTTPAEPFAVLEWANAPAFRAAVYPVRGAAALSLKEVAELSSGRISHPQRASGPIVSDLLRGPLWAGSR